MSHLVKWLPAILGAGLIFATPAQAKDASKPRTYDCSKPGNKTKAACKTAASKAATPAAPATTAKAATPAKPAAPATATASKPARNYDCSKAGNANKAACKAAVSGTPAKPAASAAAPAPAPKAAPAATKPTATKPAAPAPAATTSTAAGPNGATAQCKDGTYSNSKTHSGTCSHHGGVKTWFK